MALAKWFTNGPKHIASDVNWDTDTIRVALLDSGATIDQDADEFFDDVSADEVTGTGYTAEGAALTTSAPTADSTSNETRLDASDVVWDATGGALAAAYAVIYKDSGTPATSPLLGYVDFEGTVTATNDTFTITWDSTGVLKITAA